MLLNCMTHRGWLGPQYTPIPARAPCCPFFVQHPSVYTTTASPTKPTHSACKLQFRLLLIASALDGWLTSILLPYTMTDRKVFILLPMYMSPSVLLGAEGSSFTRFTLPSSTSSSSMDLLEPAGTLVVCRVAPEPRGTNFNEHQQQCGD